MKICSVCKIEKNLDKFYSAKIEKELKYTKGGMDVRYACKDCISEIQRPGYTERKRKAELNKELAAMGLKVCSCCKEQKKFSDFSLRKPSPDGLCYKCKDCSSSDTKKWSIENKEKRDDYKIKNEGRIKKRAREYKEKNSEKVKNGLKEWKKKNKSHIYAYENKYRAERLGAMPKWADEEKIAKIYKRAEIMTKDTGISYEVDHYYPLCGKKVCGLHCESNLRIITKKENMSKYNKMPEDFYGT